MTYARVNGTTLVQYPYGFAELQADNPHTAYPNGDVAHWFPLTDAAAASGDNLASVADVAQPTFDPITQLCVQATPTLVNGVWTGAWTVTDKSGDEMHAEAMELQCTRSQFMLAAFETGKLSAIKAFVASLNPDDATQGEIVIRFKEAPIFYRNFAGWDAMAGNIGETPADVTALFRLAITK